MFIPPVSARPNGRPGHWARAAAGPMVLWVNARTWAQAGSAPIGAPWFDGSCPLLYGDDGDRPWSLWQRGWRPSDFLICRLYVRSGLPFNAPRWWACIERRDRMLAVWAPAPFARHGGTSCRSHQSLTRAQAKAPQISLAPSTKQGLPTFARLRNEYSFLLFWSDFRQTATPRRSRDLGALRPRGPAALGPCGFGPAGVRPDRPSMRRAGLSGLPGASRSPACDMSP